MKRKSNKVVNFSDYAGYGKNILKSKKTSNRKGAGKAGLVIVLILVIAIVCICLFTPIFNIEKIEVEGVNVAYISESLNKIEGIASNDETTTNSLVSYIQADGKSYYTIDEIKEMSGIVTGTNMFKMNMNSIAERIMEAPYVRNAIVMRRLPNSIVIKIEERKVAALIDYVGSYVCIDDSGFVMNIINKKDKNTNHPIIKGVLPGDLVKGFVAGEMADADDPIKIQRVNNIISLFEKNKIEDPIEKIDVSNAEEIIVEIREGKVKINFGDLTNVNIQITRLPGILKDIVEKKGMIYMNDKSNDSSKTRFVEEV